MEGIRIGHIALLLATWEDNDSCCLNGLKSATSVIFGSSILNAVSIPCVSGNTISLCIAVIFLLEDKIRVESNTT